MVGILVPPHFTVRPQDPERGQAVPFGKMTRSIRGLRTLGKISGIFSAFPISYGAFHDEAIFNQYHHGPTHWD